MAFIKKDTNKKHAVIIGINYRNTDSELNGCINDASRIKSFLINKCNYQENKITMITDDTLLKPTKKNILDVLKNAVSMAVNESLEELWFSYSGHGSYVEDKNMDEMATKDDKNNYDEALVPLDYETNGLIIDDVLFNEFVRKIPKSCTLFSLIDACHSGTALDLPYVYRSTSDKIEEHYNSKYENDLAKIIKISGCYDSQTSADAHLENKYQGAMTFAFFKIMEDSNFSITGRQLAKRMKKYLNDNGYEQIPTLSMTKKEHLDELIIGTEVVYPNTIIILNGDQWCNNETTWNIFSLNENKNIFPQHQTFKLESEKTEMHIYLKNGTYLLIFYDSNGNGGVSGRIYRSDSNKIIKNFNFNKGSNKSFEFTIDGQQLESDKTLKLVDITVISDYYGNSESKWNIMDSSGKNMLSNDRTFSSPCEIHHESIILPTGTYKLVLTDTWGDGGLKGTIKINNTSKVLLEFNWIDKDWKTVNGNYMTFDFVV